MGKRSHKKKAQKNPSCSLAAGSSPAAQRRKAVEEDDSQNPRVAPAHRLSHHGANTNLSASHEAQDDDYQFQDPYPDEEEHEEDVVVHDDDDYDNSIIEDEEGMERRTGAVQAWNPFDSDRAGPLEMDPTAYTLYHALTPEWPSLSFDFVRDEWGSARTRFPHSLICVVGTQAESTSENRVTVMKMSDLGRIQVETEQDILGEEYDPGDRDGDNDSDDMNDDDDDDDDDDDVDWEPIVEHYSIKHHGSINRIRCMPQLSNIVATWSDAGKVHLFNTEAILQRFAVPSLSLQSSSHLPQDTIPTRPYFSYAKHNTEGYAMDWSHVTTGLMATGDCHGGIHLWNPRPDGTYHITKSYNVNNLGGAVSSSRADDWVEASLNSVEDIQWSPSEETVFASAECGGTIRIFDSRAPNRAMISHRIHSGGADVNVLSWNRLVHNLLATGSDDGVLSVWDLRHFSNSSSREISPLARFTPHQTSITSVEWHPTDESMLAVSDDRGAYIYDLSVEEDDDQNDGTDDHEYPEISDKNCEGTVLPPQLLFVHSGSTQFKEVHWHPQITSLLMTTAQSGYSVFMPSNL